MASNKDIRKIEDFDFGALAVSTTKNIIKKRPITISMWLLGLLLAAFANGFQVDDATRESYSMTLSHAQEVDRTELNKAMNACQKADDRYYNAKGWFWSCDKKCQIAKDKADMARAEVNRVQKKRDEIMTSARKEVGIWSVFGVRDVRDSFWSSWKSGKDVAARWTMMDSIFMMVGSSREETMISVILKIVMQYIMNLTVGLIGAFFYFIYNMYYLIVSYGEPTLSGVAFFLLVMVAGMSTVGTYLFAIYGTVAGGGVYLLKQAAKNAAVEGGHSGMRRPQKVQYGGRTYRSHHD